MPRASASVSYMPTSRLILSLLLAFALSGAPVLHGFAKVALPVADAAASEHAGHADGHDGGHDVATQHDHGKSGSSCAQNDSCNGQCCSSCTHSFTGGSLLQKDDDHTRSVMTPAVQHLVSSSPVFARERPPRLFSL